MNRFLLIPLVLVLMPAGACLPAGKAFAARVPAPSSFSMARSVLSASPSLGNAYAAGVSVVLSAPVNGDFSAIGGSIVTAAPVSGDELLFAGSISSRAQITGDLRAVGGSIDIEKPLGGDIFAFGFSVLDSGRPSGSVFIAAINSTITDGASGPVTIYGNNVSLGGDFSGDVKVVISGHLTLAPDTVIHGKLSYEAPEEATIPTSVKIIGGIEYENVSYLPDAGTFKILSFASTWFFLLIRIFGVLILAGLLAGLFPRLAEVMTERVYTARPRSILLTTLLGFAIIVATPILLVILLLTFVGIYIAALVFLLYALIVFFSIMYAGILIGSVLARRFAHRETVLWHDGVLGMLALSLIMFVPFVGMFVVILFTIFSAGALLLVFFNFAFPREEQTTELL